VELACCVFGQPPDTPFIFKKGLDDECNLEREKLQKKRDLELGLGLKETLIDLNGDWWEIESRLRGVGEGGGERERERETDKQRRILERGVVFRGKNKNLVVWKNKKEKNTVVFWNKIENIVAF